MAAESSWSLRGVDPRAREIARTAAKREGITIGEWLNRQLLDEGDGQSGEGGSGAYDDPEALSHVLDRLSRRIEAAEHRSTLAITGIDQSVLGVISRLQTAEELQTEFTERYTAAIEELRETQAALHTRIERVERDGGDAGGLEALKSLEEALAKVANQVYDSEAETKARLDALKTEIERASKRSGERIELVSRSLDERLSDVERKVDTDFTEVADAVAKEVEIAARKLGRNVEALDKKLDKDLRAVREDVVRARTEIEELVADRAEAGREQISGLETAVADVNTRLSAAERDTDRAIKALERSFAELDGRVRTTEARIEEFGAVADRDAFAAEIENRFAALSRELADVVSATRAEIAEKMVEAASRGGGDAIEARLEELGRQVEAAEAKQRSTLERISAEVAKLAGAVEARVRRSEVHAKARMDAIESSLAQTEANAAQAAKAAKSAQQAAARNAKADAAATPDFSKEVAELEARVAEAEAKSAAAMDAVSERVDRIDQRASEGGGASGEDLAKRIRESEERTRAMIDTALADVNRRLDHSDDQTASALSPVQRALDVLRARLESLENGGAAPRDAIAPERGADEAVPDFGALPDAEDDAADLADSTDSFEIELEMGEEIADAQLESDTTGEAEPSESAFSPETDDDEFSFEFEDAAADEPDASDAADAGGVDVAEDDKDAPAPDAEDAEASLDRIFGDAIEDARAAPPADLDELGEATEVSDPFSDDEPDRKPPEDFLRAARDAARLASVGARAEDDVVEASPGFGPVTESVGKAKKGRALLFAAGGLAFLAVGAAGYIVLSDTARVDGAAGVEGGPLDGVFARPSEDAPAMFDEDAAVEEPSAPAIAPEDTADPFSEPRLPVDLSDAGGSDFALYAEGGALFAPIEPENPAPAEALDDMLAAARAAAPAPPEAPAESAPAAEATPAPVEETAAEEADAVAEAAEAAEIVTAIPLEAEEPDAVESDGPAEPVIEEAAATPAPVEESPAAEAVDARVEEVPATMSVEAAAAQGDPAAQYELGAARLDEGDIAEGVRLMRQAAENGLAAAQYRLGKLYETGRGVPVDLSEARRWTERAANAGHRNAMHNLGIYYAEGRGAPQDFEQAGRWFEEAALLGATDSQFNLAVLYEQGLGVPLSLPDAYAWFAIAARSGDDDAQARAQAVAERLEPQALERADEAVRRFSARPLDEEANGIFRNTPWASLDTDIQASIARAQAALSMLGYAPGPADGVMGQMTIAAIRSYQTDKGLDPTGEVDTALLESLEADAGAL